MYTEKRVGPRIEPCGTPIETARGPEQQDLLHSGEGTVGFEMVGDLLINLAFEDFRKAGVMTWPSLGIASAFPLSPLLHAGSVISGRKFLEETLSPWPCRKRHIEREFLSRTKELLLHHRT